jgi:hypothetical protein
MEEEVLQQVLNEVLSELKELTKDQKMVNIALESYNTRINEFQNSLENIKVDIPQLDLRELNKTIGNLMNELKEIIKNQPKQVLHEKRILFYPEGNGENFLKFIAARFLWGIIIIASIYVISFVGFDKWKENSKNEKYRKAYLWILHEQSAKTQKYLIDNLLYFTNDSITSSRKEVIKQIENKIKNKAR